MAIRKACPKCRRVIEVSQRYCVECTKRMHKDYDRTGRCRESKDFYNSGVWLKTRRIVLEKYHGLDLYQLKVNNKIVYADTVHHIEELKENPERAIDLGNLIPLSDRSHKQIHKLYLKNKKDTQRLLFELIGSRRGVE